MEQDERNNEIDDVLNNVSPEKRAFLKAIIVGTAFVVPSVMSFSMDGLSLYQAHAQVSNLPG